MAPLTFGVLAALASALLYAVGVMLQSLEARRTPAEDSLRLSLLAHLVRRPRWIVGTAAVAGGWAMQAVALLLAPITIVQPSLAVSVIVLLCIGARFGETVRAREVVAAVTIIVGVIGLVVVSPGQSEDHAAALPLTLGMAALALVALAPFAMRSHRRFGALIVVSAGLAYAWTGFSTKFLSDEVASSAHLAALAWLGATVAAGGVGLLCEMTALQRRSPIQVFPVVLVVQIVVAVLLAPLLAGESWSPDPFVMMGLVASLAVVAVGTRALAGARTVGRAIATDDGAGVDEEAPELGEGGDGEGADHQPRQRQADDDRYAGGQHESAGGRDQAGRGDRQADEVSAILDQRKAR